jgi:hypothetical protein
LRARATVSFKARNNPFEQRELGEVAVLAGVEKGALAFGTGFVVDVTLPGIRDRLPCNAGS